MKNMVGYIMRTGEPVVELIGSKRTTLVKEEMQNLIGSAELDPSTRGARSGQAAGDEEAYKGAIEQFGDIGCVVVIPSISESEYFGKPTLLSFICLGEKLSGEPFSADDIKFLETMADHATITIEYAIILDELEHSKQRLIQAEKLAALGTMAAGVAHEIKNPLAALKLFTEVIPQKFDDPDYRNKFATLIPQELERLKRILSDLDTFSKPEVESRAEPFSVKEVIDKTIQLLSVQLKKSCVRAEVKAKGDPKIIGSPSKLMQVFLNIIINAIHAMDGGGVVTVDIEGGRIAISDTGSGISPENLRKIFNPFFTTKDTGTGLGLAITRRIVEEHKGTIDVSSEMGKGTVFTLTFPCV
jgi:signal transduction histidine kinase